MCATEQLLLAECAAALSNRTISLKAANALTHCMRDFQKLYNLRTRYIELAGKDGLRVGEVPSLAKMRQLLDAKDSNAMVIEAKSIRAALKPVLGNAKAQIDALRR
jgi:hypothetical protein